MSQLRSLGKLGLGIGSGVAYYVFALKGETLLSKHEEEGGGEEEGKGEEEAPLP